MAFVDFQRGTRSQYEAGSKSSDVIYNVVESGVNKVYLGELDLSATKAEEISIADAGDKFESTNVEGALAELASASEGGVASKTVYATKTNGASGDTYAARYTIYQGSTGSAASPVAAEKIIDIDVLKDQFLDDSDLVDITYSEGHLYDGATDVTELIKGAGGTATSADAGKYIKLVFAQPTKSTIYMKVNDLVDVYTAQQNATQVQLAIDSNNEISATVVAGSIGTTELADDAVTGAKIADDAVGAEHIAISAHTESQTAGADGLAISVTTTDGQVSSVSGSIASGVYDEFGAAADAKAEVIGEDGDAASADTLYGVRAYADNAASTAVEGLDVAEFALATDTNDIITIKGIKEVDGEIAVGTDTTKDVTFAKAAKTGMAADVAIQDAGGYTTETNVENALQEIYSRLTWGSIPAVTP